MFLRAFHSVSILDAEPGPPRVAKFSGISSQIATAIMAGG
jgi:hypothetical protein